MTSHFDVEMHAVFESLVVFFFKPQMVTLLEYSRILKSSYFAWGRSSCISSSFKRERKLFYALHSIIKAAENTSSGQSATYQVIFQRRGRLLRPRGGVWNL